MRISTLVLTLALAACTSDPNARAVMTMLAKNKAASTYYYQQRKLDFRSDGGAYLPDYEHPRTLNEKIGYLIDNYYLRSPITYVIGNKYYAKKFVADIVGEHHVVKLYGVWDDPKHIDWDKLPNKFVLKTVRGHCGRQVILVPDKSKLDISKTTKKLEEFCEALYMKKYGHYKIIAEEFLNQETGGNVDYKFFCSYGKPLFAYCSALSNDGDTIDADSKTLSWYTIPDWKRIHVATDGQLLNDIQKPKHFKKMLEIAKKISQFFPLVRIDLYQVGDRVLVGEITEDADGGKYILDPVKWDFLLGMMIRTPTKDEISRLIARDYKLYKRWL